VQNTKPIWFNQKVIPQQLKEKKFSIFVATPVHSEVSIHYTQACLEFQKQCIINGIKVTFQLMKSSLVTQGRNLCVSGFMESPCTHLLFIDSDIDFDAKSIFKMVQADKDVISIPYPLKSIQWEKGFKKIKDNKIQSIKDLKSAFFQFPMKVKDHQHVEVENGCMEVTHSPTGCMLIKRSVFEKMIEKYPEMEIKQQTIINGEMQDRPYFYNFFDTLFEPVSKVYLGEDFAFCKRWKDIGGKCYAYVEDYITHIGEFPYKGRFADELIGYPSSDNIT
tara:strand:+ start:1188 stop:2018 length:831 start_codon:yes stop_codon:yes gene_type:complete